MFSDLLSFVMVRSHRSSRPVSIVPSLAMGFEFLEDRHPAGYLSHRVGFQFKDTSIQVTDSLVFFNIQRERLLVRLL